MTIRNIEIHNLRGIQTGSLSGLGALTILTGPNGCGKSTVLDALLIWSDKDLGAALRRVVQRRPSVRNPAEWLLRAGAAGGAVGVRASGRTTTLRATSSHLSAQDTSRNDVGPMSMSKADFGISGVAFPRADAIPTRLIDSGIPDPLDKVYSDAARSGRKQVALDLLSELVGERVDLEILTEDDGSPSLYIAHASGAVPVGMSGDGVQAFLQIALNVASAPGGLVLIEEPETYQHPRAMRLTAQVIAAVVKRDVQVVLTTHSLEMIEALCDATDCSDETVLFNLALVDGTLKSSRHAGDELRTALEHVSDALR